MTASGGLYPALGKHFRSLTELAHAGCMSRQRLRDCLDGKKEFTRAEKKAISANIAAKLLSQQKFDYADLEKAVNAYQGNFDAVYRRSEK